MPPTPSPTPQSTGTAAAAPPPAPAPNAVAAPAAGVSPKQQIVERLKQANNVMVTVSQNPNLDQLASSIGLTLLLSKLGKHATTVFSGEVPSIIEFLEPEKTIEKNTDSLRDFIISLDKSKADKLRYKVEDSVVKIFITPYRTSISEDDLEFSQGDFNIDVVVALGIMDKNQLDDAIVAHGRILHDATVVSISLSQQPGSLGSINWNDPNASSLSEMLVSISESFKSGLLDAQISTAFLTGIVSETKRFSNDKTSPKVMTMSAQLMAAGANQQLIATKLEPPQPVPESKPLPEAASPFPPNAGPAGTLPPMELPAPKAPDAGAEPPANGQDLPQAVAMAPERKKDKPKKKNNDGLISIDHLSDTPADELTDENKEPEEPEAVLPDIHIDEHGNLETIAEEEPAETDAAAPQPQGGEGDNAGAPALSLSDSPAHDSGALPSDIPGDHPADTPAENQTGQPADTLSSILESQHSADQAPADQPPSDQPADQAGQDQPAADQTSTDQAAEGFQFPAPAPEQPQEQTDQPEDQPADSAVTDQPAADQPAADQPASEAPEAPPSDTAAPEAPADQGQDTGSFGLPPLDATSAPADVPPPIPEPFKVTSGLDAGAAPGAEPSEDQPSMPSTDAPHTDAEELAPSEHTTHGGQRVIEPPSHGGTLTAGGLPERLEGTTDPMSNVGPAPLLDRNSPPATPAPYMPLASEPNPFSPPPPMSDATSVPPIPPLPPAQPSGQHSGLDMPEPPLIAPSFPPAGSGASNPFAPPPEPPPMMPPYPGAPSGPMTPPQPPQQQ